MIDDQQFLPRYCTKHLRPNEVFVGFVRPTILGHVLEIALAVLVILASMFFMAWLLQRGEIGKIFLAIGIVVPLLFLLRRYVLWHFTGLMITDSRVVDFDQAGLFRRTITESSYDAIEDVNISQKGFGAILFRYGTVYIHTNGQKPDIEVAKIRHPERIMDVLANYQ